MNHPNIICIPIQQLDHSPPFLMPLVLIWNRPTNHRLVSFIRTFNVLTPIYIVNTCANQLTQNLPINGIIPCSKLSYAYVRFLLTNSPEERLWNHVFKYDEDRRNANLHNPDFLQRQHIRPMT